MCASCIPLFTSLSLCPSLSIPLSIYCPLYLLPSRCALCLNKQVLFLAVARFTNSYTSAAACGMCVCVCVCASADRTEEETTGTGIGSHRTLRIIVMTANLACPENPKTNEESKHSARTLGQVPLLSLPLCLRECVCVTWGHPFCVSFVVFKTTLKWSNEFRTPAYPAL